MKEDSKVTRSSGNVFKDMGLEDADDLAARSDMIMEINKIVKARGLKQAEIAKLVGLSQSDVSLLTRGNLTRFSTDRIMHVLVRLGRDVEIVIKTKPPRRAMGRITVKAA